MNEQNKAKVRIKSETSENSDPVKVIRKGAIAASIWRRQSPNGFAYYDFTLSRSWKAMSSEKTGYSKNFFGNNVPELQDVINEASGWITSNTESTQDERSAMTTAN